MTDTTQPEYPIGRHDAPTRAAIPHICLVSPGNTSIVRIITEAGPPWHPLLRGQLVPGWVQGARDGAGRTQYAYRLGEHLGSYDLEVGVSKSGRVSFIQYMGLGADDTPFLVDKTGGRDWALRCCAAGLEPLFPEYHRNDTGLRVFSYCIDTPEESAWLDGTFETVTAAEEWARHHATPAWRLSIVPARIRGLP